MFKVNRTYADPSSLENGQRGFPSPGSGAQNSGATPTHGAIPQAYIPPAPERPTKGLRSFFRPASGDGPQRGFPAPNSAAQRRPGDTWNPNAVYPDGLPMYVRGPDFSKGTARDVPNYGKVLTNPIGAGVVALHRPQASYGQASEYHNGAIWWTSQSIPTSVNLQGLTDPRVLAAVLGPINVQAAVRVG